MEDVRRNWLRVPLDGVPDKMTNGNDRLNGIPDVKHGEAIRVGLLEQLKLINNLDEDDKAKVFRLIDNIVTKKKFKDFVVTMQ